MQNFSSENLGKMPDSAEFEFAGFFVRLAAYTIDMAVITVGLLVVRLVFIGIDSLIAGSSMRTYLIK